jgi:hypothetical protein
MNHSWGVTLKCKIEEHFLLQEALRQKETEWDMWEEIKPQNGEAVTEAAVVLNGWLWEHYGGCGGARFWTKSRMLGTVCWCDRLMDALL